MLERLRREDCELDLFVPHHRGDVVAYLRENATVRSTEYDPKGVRLQATLSEARLGKLRGLFPEGFKGRNRRGGGRPRDGSPT